MVIDSSAAVAILKNEPERDRFDRLIQASHSVVMAAPTLLESSMVIETRFGDRGIRELDLFLVTARIEIVPFDRRLADLARVAFHLYGKGRHPAALNFGDCIAYSLAKFRDEPLLFKGTDFGRTDIRLA